MIEDNKEAIIVSALTIYDLRHAIKTMAGLFEEEHRLSGEEHDPICSRLKPIVERREMLGIHEDHRTSVRYAVLTAEARKGCKNLKLGLADSRKDDR